MSLQIIVEKATPEALVLALGPLAEHAEVFTLPHSRLGVSIPAKWLTESDGDNVLRRLNDFRVYDLYTGTWHA